MQVGYQIGQPAKTPGDFEITGDLEVRHRLIVDGDSLAGSIYVREGDVTLDDGGLNCSGNVSASGAVLGATEAGSLLVTGETALVGDMAVNSGTFSVASSTGNTAVAGTLDVAGVATMARVVPRAAGAHICTGRHAITTVTAQTDPKSKSIGVGVDEQVQQFALSGGSYTYTLTLRTDTSPAEGAIFWVYVSMPDTSGVHFKVNNGDALDEILDIPSGAAAATYALAFISRGWNDWWMKFMCVKNDI